MKIKFKNISVAICLLLIVLSGFIFASCKPNNADYSDLILETYIPANVSIIKEDKYGNSAIKVNENRDIKILQLTDTHVGNGSLSVKKDKKAINAICKLIENARPDLILITGDVVYPMRIFSGTSDNLSALKVVANVIEQYKTPWSICFGNHDVEWNSDHTKSELCEYLESDELKYCLFKSGPEDLEGMGNHIIDVYNYDDSFSSALFLIDNAEYKHGIQPSGYNPISDNTTNWYKQSIENISNSEGFLINSFAYFHVPLKEYDIAWKLYRDGNPSVKYLFGWANEPNESVGTPDETGNFFNTAVEIGSTKAMFCGHHHLNDFGVEYLGIQLVCSKSIDYLAYLVQGIASKTEQRGSTTLIIKGKNSEMEKDFDIYQTKLVDIE